jgi:mannose-6-phosphate isomerase-like protein (cupin superfamily)
MLRASVVDLLQRLPGHHTANWPEGERFTEAFARGTLFVELYAPEAIDAQKPHTRDEVYFVVSGSGEIVVAGERTHFAAGDALFVPAGAVHRFENFSAGFVTWVVFYGPEGGESPQAT